MRILVTGGSGAFGAAFVREALTWEHVERLAVFSRDEHKQQRLSEELGRDPRDRLRFFLGDVRDERRLEMALRGVTHVVHAAALKVVPWLEYNPTEGVRTNVEGATNLVEAAIRSGVSRVVALSTDKSVAPLNLYGATKLVAEKLFLAANAVGGGATRFTVVRYGNVTGSTGSVVPLWRPLAKADEALPLTDDRMTRFWMTLADAVGLVKAALYKSVGGEVIVPKLPSYKVRELGEAIWKEQNPGSEWAARFKAVGLRPGEKLHESLVSEDEAPWVLDCGTHYEIRQAAGDWGPGGKTERAAAHGTPVPEGFTYRSDGNDQWLDKTALLERLRTVSPR